MLNGSIVLKMTVSQPGFYFWCGDVLLLNLDQRLFCFNPKIAQKWTISMTVPMDLLKSFTEQ